MAWFDSTGGHMKHTLQWTALTPRGHIYSVDFRCYTAADVEMVKDMTRALLVARRSPKLFVEKAETEDVPF